MTETEIIRQHLCIFGLPWERVLVTRVPGSYIVDVHGCGGWMFSLKDSDAVAAWQRLEAYVEDANNRVSSTNGQKDCK